MDGGFSSKRKILLISHSVGAEAMGDQSVPAAAADKGQALLREKKAGASAHDDHSPLKAAKPLYHDASFYPAVRTQLRELLSERQSFVFLILWYQAGSYDSGQSN